MKILNTILLFAALAFAHAQPALAAVSGAELLSRCDAAERSLQGEKLSGEALFDGMWCMGYVSGLLDGFGVGDFKIGTEKAVCPPEEGLTREQALKSVTRWLRENPDALQKSGRRGAILALSRSYPCH